MYLCRHVAGAYNFLVTHILAEFSLIGMVERSCPIALTFDETKYWKGKQAVFPSIHKLEIYPEFKKEESQ